MIYLPSSAADYLEARKYYSRKVEEGGHTEEIRMAQLAKEACRFAFLRKENPFLRNKHLADMHLEPVFFAGNKITQGLPGGGFVDAKRGAVIILDEISGELKYHPLNWELCGSRLRFPPDGRDLRDIYT